MCKVQIVANLSRDIIVGAGRKEHKWLLAKNPHYTHNRRRSMLRKMLDCFVLRARFPSPDSVPNYQLLFKTGLIHKRLDRNVKSAPVIFIDFNEPEWLQRAGNRNQQFCCGEYQASLYPEHQFNGGALIEGARQAK